MKAKSYKETKNNDDVDVNITYTFSTENMEGLNNMCKYFKIDKSILLFMLHAIGMRVVNTSVFESGYKGDLINFINEDYKIIQINNN